MRALWSVAAVAVTLVSGAQTASRKYVILSSSDTVAVEEVTRAGSTITGELHLLNEKASVHYVLHLRPDGATETADVVNDSPSFFTGTIAFGGAAASIAQQGRGPAGRLSAAPEDMLPVIGVSMGLIDYVLRLHPPKTGETVQLKVLNIRNRNPGTLSLKRFARDSVLVDCDGCMRARATEELRVGLSRDGGMAGATRVETHWTVSTM